MELAYSTLTQLDEKRPKTISQVRALEATEKKARETHDVVTAVVHFDSTTRTIIDGHKVGFCKLIAGCHVIGERAVDIVQVAA